MIIKIETPKGGGSIKDRLDYLLDRDPSTVSVLWRDLPESALISYDHTITRKTKYYRAIVGFSAEEYARLSKKDKQRLLDDLMEQLFYGYKHGNRPPVHIVEHRDTKAVHWHVTIVNDVAGRDSRFWFPKRDLPWLASVQDYLNRKYGLDDPRERIKDFKKFLHGKYSAIFSKDAEDRTREYLRRRLYSLTQDLIERRIVSNREGLINYLQNELGLNVVRKGKNFITVQIGRKKVRLKGAWYERGATYHREGGKETQRHSGAHGADLADLQRRIAEFGYRRYRALGKVANQVVASLPSSGSGDRTLDRLEDLGRALAELRKLSNHKRQHRKSLSTSSRALKEERWRQLSALSTSQEHQDLLQKTSKILEDLIEQLNKTQKIHLPKDLFAFKREEEYEKGGMSI